MTEKKLTDVPMTELPMDMVQAVAEGRVKRLHDIQVRVMASMLLARERLLSVGNHMTFTPKDDFNTEVSYYDVVVAQIYKAHLLKDTFSVWSADGKTALGNNFRNFPEAVKFVIKLIQEGKIG